MNIKKNLPIIFLGFLWFIATIIFKNGIFKTTEDSSLTAIFIIQFFFIPLMLALVVTIYQDKLLGFSLIFFWITLFLQVFKIPYSIYLLIGSTIPLLYFWIKSTLSTKKIPLIIIGITLILIAIDPILNITGILTKDRFSWRHYSLITLLIGTVIYLIIKSKKGDIILFMLSICLLISILAYFIVNLSLDFDLFTISNELFIVIPLLIILFLSFSSVKLYVNKSLDLSRILSIICFYLSINLLVIIMNLRITE